MDLDLLKQIPLSDAFIKNRLRGKTNVLMYKELKSFPNIESLLVDDSAVILYEKRPKNGHWVCLIRYINNGVPTIEFFDSYGIFPDKEKKYISDSFLLESDQKKNTLAALLYDAAYGYVIE